MLIAFEGLPGAGKTTQSRLLADHLTREQVPVNYLPDNLTRTEGSLGSTLLDLFASGDPFSRHGNIVTDTMLATAIRTNTVATHITPSPTWAATPAPTTSYSARTARCGRFLNEGGDGRGGWKDIGTIATGSSAWTASQVRFADVGGDARADYLVLNANGAVRALLNTTTADGGIKWSDQGVIATGSARWTAEDIRFADIGGDSRADYLILADNGALTAYENATGTGPDTEWKNLGIVATGTGSPGSRVRV